MARHDLAAAKRLNQVDDNADTGPDSGSTPVRSPLRTVMSACAVEHGLSAKDLTVLAPQNDPFRLETPARHRDGEWLAMTARELGLGDRKIHLRGLHYMVIGRPKPDGTPYTNTDADWLWLSGDAGKAARWLGYLPFDQITDQRNAAPVVRIFERPAATWRAATRSSGRSRPATTRARQLPGCCSPSPRSTRNWCQSCTPSGARNCWRPSSSTWRT